MRSLVYAFEKAHVHQTSLFLRISLFNLFFSARLFSKESPQKNLRFGLQELHICYASWGPIFWPFLSRSARAPTMKAVRGTIAIKGVFDNKKGPRFLLWGFPFPLRGHRFPCEGIRSPYGPLAIVKLSV